MPNSSHSNHTYKLVEIVGTSPESFAGAVRNGVERASKSLRHLDWFEVTEMRGRIADGHDRAVSGEDEGGVPAGRRVKRVAEWLELATFALTANR